MIWAVFAANSAHQMKFEMQVRKLAPKSLRRQSKKFGSREMACHITCAVSSQRGEVLASYNDEVRLFKIG